jgi:hypothetical protein
MMSRRRRRVREAGPVRKTVEVVVSALFGMAVVGVVLVVLQGGTSPASQGPDPAATLTVPTADQGVGADGGIGIRSGDTGTQSATGSGATEYSAVPAPNPTTPAQGAEPAQESGTGVPASSSRAGGTAGASQTSGTGSARPSTGASGGASASASASSGTGALGGLVGGLVGGVLGLL